MVVAEIFLSAFIQAVFQKLQSERLIRFAHRGGIHTTVTRWTNMLRHIQAVLRDAEEKQITDEAVKMWLDDLRDLAYDVDDILDEFCTEALGHKIMGEPESSTVSKVRSLIPTCCTSPSAFMSNMRIGSKLKQMTSRLEDISKRRTDLGLVTTRGETSTIVGGRLPSTSLVVESHVYGRDKDRHEIIAELLKSNAPTDDNYGVISIVGMGGLGKTTLAQLVYNDDTVKQHFDLKAWACVSDVFDVTRITKAILEECTSQTSDYKEFNQVQNKLKEALTGKRFLIVLDDVWNKKYGDWDALQIPFTAGKLGSKVLVTTRESSVALKTGFIEYKLKQLSKPECWSVFVRHAFGNRTVDANARFKEIGEKIVDKCRGLPLAVKTLAGVLRCKLNDYEWEEILESKIWDLPDEESDILPALQLSYHHLPPHLKPCFAYLSILPKDYEFEEKEITLLWMAEGFLQQPKQEKQMETLGGEYFRDLLSRSFFQQSNSDISRYVMHDLVNDLAQWVAGDICFKFEDKLKTHEQHKSFPKARHSSYIAKRYDGMKKFETFHQVKCLRTFMPFHLQLFRRGRCYLTKSVLVDLLPKLRCLRVLSLNGYCITELPDSIGDLKHLRYLDLSFTQNKILPESLTTLCNLQTLLLTKCSCLERLPTGMRNLTNLRHLNITGVYLIKEMPPQMGMLTNLQTLSKFIVGRGSESGIQELRNLLHLQKVLSISQLENVTKAWEAQEAKLNDKIKLDVLELEWNSALDDISQTARVAIDVLEKLQPQEKLKALTIRGYIGTRFPTWIGLPSFSDMVFLRLENCVQCISLPPLGQLPLLKDLCITRMNGVNSVGPEFFGDGYRKLFPSLKTLSFEDMQEWEAWSPPDINRQVEVFSQLRELSIRKCPKLQGRLPDHLPSLEKLVIRECGQLVISILSLPKLCELDISCRQEVRQITWLTDGFVRGLTRVEALNIRSCSDLTCLWQKEVGLLQHLTSLCHLTINSCPNFAMLVAEKEEEEVERHQHGLPCRLESLELYECHHREKLQGLPTMLRKLTIDKCQRLVSFPKTGLPPMLRELHISDCRDFESLPLAITLCSNSTSLEDLRISGCPSLTFIARGQLPSTLKRLRIEWCENLTSLLVEEEGCLLQKSNDSNTSLLEELHIEWCRSLKSLSSRGELPITLKKLFINCCSKLESIAESLHNNTSVEDIRIWNCESLKALPEGLHNLNHLSSISITKCPSLAPHGIHNLTSLRDLKKLTIVSSFPASIVSSFPEDPFPANLTSLEIRFIKNCKPLFEWDLHLLTSLKTLIIYGVCPDLVSFPEEKEEKGMILPASLTTLSIEEFPNLEYLSSKGFHNLASLEFLLIKDCPKLKSFPEKGLPPSLLELLIWRCPLLQQLCHKDKEIANIPCIEIH